MPQPIDESEANPVPDPELNPLLNPVLAAHMGRWAEVYFTNPPEKRGEAVAELIRELSSSGEPGAAQAISDGEKKERISIKPAPHVSYPVEHLRTCSACAYENRADQNFCGMCGSPLQVLEAAEAPRLGVSAPASEAARRELEDSAHENSASYATESTVSAAMDYVAPTDRVAPARPGRAREEFSRQQFRQELDLPHFLMEAEPVPYRYRLYVGVALAILLLALVYTGWRGATTISGGNSAQQPTASRVIPAAPPAPVASSQPPRAAPANPPEENVPAQPAPSKAEAAAAPGGKTDADTRRTSQTVTRAANSSSVAMEQSSADDLATAESYLYGTQGRTRDSREAASWLWKAVSKGNRTATLTLSDLYLRGEGVPKNCDQARLLLDAAARKGVHAAADRLRNLQAFGCQ